MIAEPELFPESWVELDNEIKGMEERNREEGGALSMSLEERNKQKLA